MPASQPLAALGAGLEGGSALTEARSDWVHQAPEARQLSRQVEAWIAQGEDEPQRVLSMLAMQPHSPQVPEAVWQRAVWRARGWVAARSGLTESLHQALAGLRLLDQQHPDGHNVGDQALIQAAYEELRGQASVAYQHAVRADETYGRACRDAVSGAWCDYRAWWRAVRTRLRWAQNRGSVAEARDLIQKAAQLARVSGDAVQQVVSLGFQARQAYEFNNREESRRLIQQAYQVAHQSDQPIAEVYARVAEMQLLHQQDQMPAARQVLEGALNLARASGSARLEALVLINLGDVLARLRQYKQALDAVQHALPVVQRHNDLPNQAVLLHNAGLVRLRMGGQDALARSELEKAQELWEASGGQLTVAQALDERSQTMEALGNAREAVALYHQSQRLLRKINQEARSELINHLRQQYEAESQRLDLGLLERERLRRNIEMSNQSRSIRVAVLAVVVLLLLALLVVLLIVRARDVNLRLSRSEALLRVQSERDALTGLANRRHFRDVLLSAQAVNEFYGAVLLIDIDHFKRINDEHGHAVGDVVLTEVAQRLGTVVRAEDLVCRWGGEEFLIYTRNLGMEAVQALARRVLHAVGDEPVSLPVGRALHVTASVGYGNFPMPAHQLRMSWSHAVNLVDMALYTAKSLGRDRAVGVLRLSADSLQALDALEQDFEAARQSGQIDTEVIPRRRSTG